jgi:tetratricopeptide (TPR) repeat protein/serine phosphatase RsbU (regulator of sigma subunit)
LTESTFAQSNVDSLLNLFKATKTDSIKVTILNNLCKEYSNNGDYDKALQYANQSLLIVNSSGSNPSIQADAYNAIGTIFYYKGETEKALEFYSKTLQIHARMNDKRGMASSYGNIGIIHQITGEYAKALEFHFKSVKMDDEMGNRQGMADSYNNIGIIYENKGDYAKALEFHLKSLKIQEGLGNKAGIAASYSNLGIIHQNNGDYDKALGVQLKSLAIYETEKNMHGMADSYLSIGNTYYYKNDMSKALEYYLMALAIQERTGNKAEMAGSYNNIASIHFSKNEYPEALEFFSKSLALYEEMGDKQGVAMNYSNIGSLCLKEKKPAEAKRYQQKSLAIATEIAALPDIKNAYEGLFKADSAMGNFKEAYEYHKLFTEVKDKIFNEEASKKAVQTEMNFEFEKKEQATKLEQEKKNVLANEELKKQTLQRNAFVAAFLFMLALAAVSYRSYRNKRKAHEVIAVQKSIVEEKNKDILDSINYAKRIQDALLKEEQHASAFPLNHFILFKPKDIVSGDFYWHIEKQGCLFLAAVDCTGHGVPGAFMSMLGISFLNEITAKEELISPAEILERLREKIIKELSQKGEDGESKDGMDISLIRLNLATKELQWAGANNPLWIVNRFSKELTEIKPDKQPIGFYHDQKPFTNHTLLLKKEESIYLFTDGYADQFGGEKEKKFKYSKLKELIISIQDKTIQEQKEELNASFESWKGNLSQVDDVCIIGLKP